MNTQFPTEPFDLIELNRIYELSPIVKNDNNKFVRDLSLCKLYFNKYIFPLTTGEIVLYDTLTKSFECQDKDNFHSTYLSRCPKELSIWFKTSPCVLYTRTIKLNQQLIINNTINFAGKFKFQEIRPYKDISQEIQNKVNTILNFYKEIWASNDTSNYEFIINWIANMCQGNKNSSLLYLKSSVQGIGKSFGTDFLMKYVIGNELSIVSGGKPLLSNFTKSLFGKLLVVFEELQTSGKSDWEMISNKIKTMATGTTLEFEEKNQKSFVAENISNSIIATNNEAIRETEGRRIYNADVSSRRKNDSKYFENLVQTCFNDEVGYAFYCLMKDRDVSKFNPQKYTMRMFHHVEKMIVNISKI